MIPRESGPHYQFTFVGPSKPLESYTSVVPGGCSSAVVHMTLKAYGLTIPQVNLAREMNADTGEGAGEHVIKIAFQQRGLMTLEESGLSWEKLKYYVDTFPALPKIVEFMDYRDYIADGVVTSNPEACSHYVHVTSMTDDTITFEDSAYGRAYTMSREEWEKSWNYRTGETPDNSVKDNGWILIVARGFMPDIS